MKKIIFLILLLLTSTVVVCINKNTINDRTSQQNYKSNNVSFNETNNQQFINNKDDIDLKELNESGMYYSFKYNGKEYNATYTKENWHINNSYQITNQSDIEKICQALIEVHPIHGIDMVSYRTAEDLAFEWIQHNIAYSLLTEDNHWRENAKHVDLNPEDQGKNLLEMYEERTKKN